MQFRKLKAEFLLAIEFYCDVTSEHSCSTGMNKRDKNWRIYTDDFQHKEVNFQLCIEFSLTIYDIYLLATWKTEIDDFALRYFFAF